jgi:tol-pal system protein YbgF
MLNTCGVLGIALLSMPVVAQSTRDRITTLETSVARLQRLLENNQGMQTDLLRRINELQSENQSLRDDIDRLQFDSTQNADRQRQLYLDLDQRIQAMEAGGGAAATVADAGGQPGTVGSDEQSYQAAFELLKAGQYAEAQAAFGAFLSNYPDSAMRGNAQYWLAETYYVTKSFETAVGHFRTVINDYPTTRKVPDAWLKLGYCNFELQRWDDARLALNTVVARYADSTAARLAEQRLAEMQKLGH